MTERSFPRRAVRADGYAALEEALVAEVRRVRRSDPLRPIDLLVGSNLLGVHLRRLLARSLEAVAAVRTQTFLDLARRRAEAGLAAAGLRPIPPLGDELLIGRIVEGLPSGGYFEPVRTTPGFRVALLASLRDLKDAGWAAADLRSRLRASGLGEDSLRKLDAFAGIFESYERALRERRLYDRSDLLARAAAGVEGSSNGSDAGHDAILLAYGFYDMIELQWRLFEAESRRRETVAFVPAGEGPAFLYAAPLMKRMEEAGFVFAPQRGGSVRPSPSGLRISRADREPGVEPSHETAAIAERSASADPTASARSSLRDASSEGRTSEELARLLDRLFESERCESRAADESASAAAPAGTEVFRARGQLSLFETDEAPHGPALTESASLAGVTESGATVDAGAADLSPEDLARLPVGFLSAPSEEREGEEIAAQVLAWAGQGIRFHEIALLARQREPHLTTLARALRRAGVPCVLASGESLAESPAAAAFAALLAIPLADWRRGDVVAFLSLADLPPPLRSLPDGSEASSSEWDSLSAEGGVVGGLEDWRRAFTRGIGRAQARIATLEEEQAKAAGAAVGAVVRDDDEGDVEDRLANARREVLLWRRLEDTIRRIETALGPWERSRTWLDAAEVLRGALIGLMAASDARDAIEAMIASLGVLDAVGPYPGAEAFAAMARRALAVGRVRRGRYERDGVLVADVVSSRGLSFRAVVIAGMVEKGFPVQGREDPVLLEAERGALASRAALASRGASASRDASASRAGGPAPLPLKSARQAEEKLLFRIAAGAAREHLLLTSARAMGVEERESLPSPFLREAREAFARVSGVAPTDATSRDRRVPLFPPLHVESATALDARAWAASEAWRLGATGGGGAAAGAPLLREVFPFLELALAADRGRWRTHAFGAHDGLLGAGAAAVAAERLLLEPLSASRIERYASCPLRAFFETAMGVRSLRDPAEVTSIDPRDRGTLYHRILAELFAALSLEAGGPVPLADLDASKLHERLLETAERRFEALAASTPVGYPLLWEVEKARMRENLKLALDEAIEESRESGFLPAAFEWTFGRGEGSAGAVALDLASSGTVRFQGRIDRIDVHRDGRRARVIDYKTRDAEYVGGESRIADGRSLQLPIYMRAASQLRASSGAALDVESGGYVFLSGDKPRGIGRDGESERAAALGSALDVLIASVRAGDFTADPRDPGACKFCDFQDPCGEDRQRLFGRKRGEPAVAARLALRERS